MKESIDKPRWGRSKEGGKEVRSRLYGLRTPSEREAQPSVLFGVLGEVVRGEDG